MPYHAQSSSQKQYDNLSVKSSFSQSSLGLQATLDPLENLEGFLSEVAPHLEGCELFSSNREVKVLLTIYYLSDVVVYPFSTHILK